MVVSINNTRNIVKHLSLTRGGSWDFKRFKILFVVFVKVRTRLPFVFRFQFTYFLKFRLIFCMIFVLFTEENVSKVEKKRCRVSHKIYKFHIPKTRQ